MKATQFLQKAIHHKTTLYVAIALFFLNLIGHASQRHFDIVLYLVMAVGIMSTFSKNRVVILLSALALVHLYTLGQSQREGMDVVAGDLTDEEKKTIAKARMDKLAEKQKAAALESDAATVLSGDDKDSEVPENSIANTSNSDGFESGSGKKGGKVPSIDYASTVESAYSDLNNILGSDGIKSLTSDTQNLVSQQKQLAEAMQGMAPLINNFGPLMDQATTMMKSMGDTGGLGNLAKIADGLAPRARK
mgnify:CR=1 FL=1